MAKEGVVDQPRPASPSSDQPAPAPLEPHDARPRTHVRLFVADGADFTGDLTRPGTHLAFDSVALEAEFRVGKQEEGLTRHPRTVRPRNKSARAREARRLRAIAAAAASAAASAAAPTATSTLPWR